MFTGTTTQEVKGRGDEDKCDQDVEKLTVLDDPAVDIDHQEGKIRLGTIAAMSGTKSRNPLNRGLRITGFLARPLQD